MKVKFREGVPDEIQNNVREFLQAAGFTEAMYGFPVNYVQLCKYLEENECIAATHVYGIEVLPVETWVKEEVDSFPPEKAEYYKKLLRESLARRGFPPEKIDKWMDDATVAKRDAVRPCKPDYKECVSEIIRKYPSLAREAQNGSWKAKRDIVALCLHRLNGYLDPKLAFIYLDTMEKLAKSANPKQESPTCSSHLLDGDKRDA